MKKKIAAVVLAAGMIFAGCAGEKATSEKGTSSAEQIRSDSRAEQFIQNNAVDLELTKEEDGMIARDIYAMDTYMTIKAHGDRAKEAIEAASKEIHRIDQMLSAQRKGSEIDLINQNGGGTVSADTEYLLKRSQELYQSTGGAFDIAIYPAVKLWGFPTKNFPKTKAELPTTEQLKQALSLADGSKISLDEKQHVVKFGKKGMEIDLGGIAKGYTSARIMEIFRQYQVDRGLLSLGGNVQTCGKKPDGSAWKIAIQSPKEDGNYLGVLTKTDCAVITSGGYERYFDLDGKRYHHIIDPKSGYPAENGVQSSTIVSRDGTLADGLSTALFIMGVDKASEYWRSHKKEFDFILEDTKGELYVTEGVADQFKSDLTVHIVH